MAGENTPGARADGAADALATSVRRAALEALGNPDADAVAIVDVYAAKCAEAIRRDLPAAVAAALRAEQ